MGVGGGARRARRRVSGGEAHTTNQRMEITAALEAVRALRAERDRWSVVSDSTYVVNCFRDRWWVKWEANGWRNAKKQPVANADLWRPLVELVTAARRDVPLGQGPQRRPPQRPRRPARRRRRPADGSVVTRQAGIARSRSATRSSPSSRPIEIRSRPGVMPDRRLLVGAEADVGARGRVAHERLGAAERRRRAGDAEVLEHRAGGVDAAGEIDGEHRRQATAAGREPGRAAGGGGSPGWWTAATPGWASRRTGEAQGDVGLVALAHGERADAAQPVERVVRRRRWRRAARRRTRSRRAGRARRRRRRAWRRCGRRCPWWPSAARGRCRGSSGCWPIGVANVESTTVNGPRDGAEVVEVDEVEARVRRALGDHEHRACRDARRRRRRRARCRRRRCARCRTVRTPPARTPTCRRRSGAG